MPRAIAAAIPPKNGEHAQSGMGARRRVAAVTQDEGQASAATATITPFRLSHSGGHLDRLTMNDLQASAKFDV